MRILASTSLLVPYRVDWLNELGKYADVDILYLEERDAERNQAWLSKRPERCSYRLMKGIRLPKLGKISLDFIRAVKKEKYDVVLLDGYGYVTQVLNIWYLNRKKIKYYVNIDGSVPKEQQNPVAKRIKEKLISRIPCFLCGSKATNQILTAYGSAEEKIVNHPFTSLFEKDIFENIPSNQEKASLREKWNIREKHMVISVGRFSYLNGYGKGYDAILRAASRLKDPNIGWYIVGGKPTAEFEKMTEDLGLSNVHYVEFLNKEDLREYYRAADLSVLMTVGDVWGLVINEAMACGLPVITTDKCVAGVELITNGENGYIVPVGDDEALAKYTAEVLRTPGAVETMGENSLKKIRYYTIENVARIHMEAFKRDGEI